MSTSTSATKRNAKSTAGSAKETARNAKATARSATATPRAEARATERGVTSHTRRIAGAAQAEVSAVASQPTRPLFFALGLADRTVAGVRAVPSKVVDVPTRTRQRVVSAFASAGDLAERAQRGYTEVAVDGEKLVRAVRRQESTQEAVKYAERAQTRGQRAVTDTEKAVDAGTEAIIEAAKKLG
jgi:hypothetical protein